MECKIYTKNIKGLGPGLVVKGGDWCSRDREFESRHRILERSFITFICCKIVLFENITKSGNGKSGTFSIQFFNDITLLMPKV